MKSMTTVIRGLAIDVVLIETMQSDAVGILFYRADILVRGHRTGLQRLVRRTRIPDTGRQLVKAVQHHGVWALDGLAVEPTFHLSTCGER
ncbi:MAG: hypothetical protein EON58_01015 [Alphaproteobacteria bacterium]|nr:MAG: hypothetical protein EON58_01015 [Alphaproteobacteria bacterium]